MRSANDRRSRVLRKACHSIIEAMEARILLSALPNPPVPVPPLPQGTEPLIGVVGSPLSLSPQMMRTLYGLNDIYYEYGNTVVPADGRGQTIAIVDAYGSPSIINDVVAFDSHWGLGNADSNGNFFLTVQPLAANEDTITEPASDINGWGVETSLDVEWAHVIAPEAHILLIEAPSDSLLDLVHADVYAAEQADVSVVSNSWGLDDASPTFEGETARFDGFFSTPVGHNPVAFFASSGDTANELNFPASSDNVVPIGGATVNVNLDGTDTSMGAWGDSSGGQVPYNPSYHEPIVSLDADPLTGVWVYDSTDTTVPTQPGAPGWIYELGGTSLSCPMFAAYFSTVQQGLVLENNGNMMATIGSSTNYDGSTVFGDLILAGESSPIYFQQVEGNEPKYPLWGLGKNPAIPDYTKLPNNDNTGFGSLSGIETDNGWSYTHNVTDLFISDQSPDLLDYTENANGTVTTEGIGVANTTAAGITFPRGFANSNGVVVSASDLPYIIFTENPDNSEAGQTLSTFEVQVDNPGGAVDSSYNDPIIISYPEGQISGTLTVDAVDGVATFSDVTISSIAGNAALTATGTDVIEGLSGQFDVTPAAATHIAIVTQPGNVYQYFSVGPIVADIEDVYDNVVYTDNSSVQISVASGPGNFTGPKTAKVVGGVATISGESFNIPGTYTLEISDPSDGITSATTATFAVVGVPVVRRFLFNGVAISSPIILVQQQRDSVTLAGSGVPATPANVLADSDSGYTPSAIAATSSSTSAAADTSSASSDDSSLLDNAAASNLRNNDVISSVLEGN
jgi:hypothetical protein